MSPAPAPLLLAVIAVLARAFRVSGIHEDERVRIFVQQEPRPRALDFFESAGGCSYEGRWYRESGRVPSREPCLRCVCARGALACRRRACSPPPDPPSPSRCHLLHRRGSCCPELHCPDGVTLLEQEPLARSEDMMDIATPSSTTHVCVEGGTAYAAGSAMSSGTACEQCFCLGGARRCVRPRCLPLPPGCRARPAPGACCPQKYYCGHPTSISPGQKHTHDCKVQERWITEGERVVTDHDRGNCTHCFCLRGTIQCQPLACAPPLLGCKPILHPGDCCPQQYDCDHQIRVSEADFFQPISDNKLVSTKNDDRSLHTSKSSKPKTPNKSTTSKDHAATSTAPVTKEHPVVTTKFKRKTSDLVKSFSAEPSANYSSLATEKTTTITTEKQIPTTELSTLSDYELTSTEQPEGTVKITVNGTVNCTAELSSTTLPLNFTVNEANRITNEVQPRVPYKNIVNEETQTFNPNDIITDRYVNMDFDENESFVINVTSSLRTNSSTSTVKPIFLSTKKILAALDLSQAVNISKKNRDKEDYDYDYTEPTLPPSLPNLKIIPFVAADAVVDEEKSSKNILTYPILEREDKFPVYYPNIEAKDTSFAIQKQEYHETKYPIFTPDKEEIYSLSDHELTLPDGPYILSHNPNNDIPSLDQYLLSASLGNRIPGLNKATTKIPTTTSSFKLQSPSVNLFSPPIETEGGFVPKGVEMIDDFYIPLTSTPSGSSVPHLTTSMQLDSKSECTTSDGRQITEGDSILRACSLCTCTWGEFHCSPKQCITPVGCKRRPISKSVEDVCCGELICDNVYDKVNATMLSENKVNSTKIIGENVVKVLEPPKLPPLENDVKDATNFTSENNRLSNESLNQYVNRNDFNETIISHKITTSAASATHTTEKIYLTTVTEVTTETPYIQTNHTNSTSQEYEYDDEEGFSFGSVLKLLLSDSYETTTVANNKRTTTLATRPLLVTKPTQPETVKPTTEEIKIKAPLVTRPIIQVTTKASTPIPPVTKPIIKTTTLVTTTQKPSPPTTVPSFIPMPQHFVPPKKSIPQSTVNRVDHLVLGEATAIKKTNPYPAPQFKPKPLTTILTTTMPASQITNINMDTLPERYSTVTEVSRKTTTSPFSSLGGAGFLKLAGCNIYGRMYRVDKVIAELSTDCQECRCTEFGVQCRSLGC